MSQEKATLIYVGDPMCSWCYGFEPELTEILKALNDEVDFELVMGGLRPYNKETMLDLKDFLTHHWEDVNKASGQKFSYGILDDQTITYDTEPPSRATIVVRRLAPEKEFAFFQGTQILFYKENKNMHLAESYTGLLEDLEIDVEQFAALFESEEMKTLVREDFVRAGEMGVRGFPSMLLKQGDQYTLIANGYAKSEKIIATVRAELK